MSAVLITDTWGRPWRDGLVDFAIGVAGMDAMLDLRGATDLTGRASTIAPAWLRRPHHGHFRWYSNAPPTPALGR